MHFTLYGNPITKKNSQRIVRVRKKQYGRVIEIPMIMPSKQYVDYERDCLMQITGKLRKHIAVPVNVKCVYFMQTRRKADLVNLLEASLDIMVKAGIIDDDNHTIVFSHDGCRVDYDKENPRVEITIERIEEKGAKSND